MHYVSLLVMVSHVVSTERLSALHVEGCMLLYVTHNQQKQHPWRAYA